MIERIKFSFLRDLYKVIKFYIKFILSKITKMNYLWSFEFKKNNEEGDYKILLFAPSMTIDKPNFLNVGLRNLIEQGKKENFDFYLLQCVSGLDICHLGGSPFSHKNKMPCNSCIKVNKHLYKDLNIINFSNIEFSSKYDLDNLSFNELINYTYKNIEVGKLSHSSVSWILRTSELNKGHKGYFIQTIKSSIKLINFLETANLDSYDGVLVFNGISMPEAILYNWCKSKKINVATFEGGWSSKYSMEINYNPTPQHFFKFTNRLLTQEEDTKLAKFILDKRSGLKQLDKLKLPNKKIVSVFGNVSWDTSQFISNDIFSSMFDWLNNLIPITNKYEDYLFIFKSHPGENRKIKKTWYGLDFWFNNNMGRMNDNVICFDANSKIDSYEIIENSDLVLVYNSTVGIDAASLGKKTLVAAKTHYTNLEFVNSYDSKNLYLKDLNDILSLNNISVSEKNQKMAKSYYYQLLNNVSYDYGEIVQSLKFNEETLIKDYLTKDVIVDDVKELLQSFVKKSRLEKIYNN